MNEFNQKSIAIFNNKEAKFYETINYESFDIGKAKDMELSANDLIKCAYADGSIEVKGNDMAVFYLCFYWLGNGLYCIYLMSRMER